MNSDIILNSPQDIVLPEDAVFERAPILPHDLQVRPASPDALHIDGDSRRGDVVEYLHFDPNGETFTHEMKQDVEPTLEWVKTQQSMYGSRAGKSDSGEWYHAARVPQVVILAWLNERGLKWEHFKGEVVDRFLNDSNNSGFRVWQGRV